MSEKITKTLRFDKELVNKAKKIATLDKRSFNNWLEKIIEREVAKN